MSYRLYYSPGACSLAVHIVLEEIGVPFERHQVSVARGENHAAAFVAINPKARVPALEVTGETHVLTELPAIVTFLARQHPQARLLPASNALEEARCHEWLAWLVGWVHGDGYGALWRPARFAADAALHDAISAHGRHTIIESYVSIEAKLANAREWALASGYSIVDPFLLVLYRWGNRIGLPMQSHYPAWTALTERILKRPAVQRAMASEQVRIDR